MSKGVFTDNAMKCDISLLYKYQGKLDEAEKMYQRVLQGKEKAWDPDHINTGHGQQLLSVLYKPQSEPDEAEEMYQWALQRYDSYKRAQCSRFPRSTTCRL